METSELAAFRPIDKSAAAAEASLARIDAAILDTKAKIPALAVSRTKLLLEGSSSAILAADQQKALLGITLEQLETLRLGVKDRLADAQREEELAKLRIVAKSVSAMVRDCDEWALTKYRALVAEVTEAMEARRQAKAKSLALYSLIEAAAEHGPTGIAVPQLRTSGFLGHGVFATLEDSIVLPALKDGDEVLGSYYKTRV